MEPFETRGEARGDQRLGADLSGARLDRMRARGVNPARTPSRAVFAWVLVAILLAFALGLIANPWFERSVRGHLPGFAPTLTPTVADLTALDARVAALESRPARTLMTSGSGAAAEPADGERLARIEATVATLGATVPAADARASKLALDLATLTGRIDATSSATAATLAGATTAAERAQAMLVVAEARRQLANGTRLGALEPALRRSFSVRAPVEAVAALGANPVTLAALRAGLDQLRPALTGDAAAVPGQRDWWQGLRDTLAGIVTRPAAGSGNDAASRVDRAARALSAGNAAGAIAEIAALPAPARARARDWLTAAARYDAGWRALGQLETLLLDPAPATALPVTPLP